MKVEEKQLLAEAKESSFSIIFRTSISVHRLLPECKLPDVVDRFHPGVQLRALPEEALVPAIVRRMTTQCGAVGLSSEQTKEMEREQLNSMKR